MSNFDLIVIFVGLWLQMLTATDQLILINLDMPSYARLGSDVTLTCIYDLETDGLYSLKWYKDKQEFFSFIPRLPGNSRRIFQVPGVNLGQSVPDPSKITLFNVTNNSSGVYKCQVSGEAPLFTTVAREKTLTVAIVPESGPEVTQIASPLSLGDWLRMNCTTKNSRPVPRITWLINGIEVTNDLWIRRYPVKLDTVTDLFTTTLGLEFWIREDYFSSEGKLVVQCRASIPDVYREESFAILAAEHSVPHKVLKTIAEASSGSNVKMKKQGKLIMFMLLISFMNSF